MWRVDAGADADAGGRVCGAWARADAFLAGDCPRGRRVGSGLDDERTARAAVRARHGANRARVRCGRAGAVGVAKSTCEWTATGVDVGLRLFQADGANAIHGGLVRRDRDSLVRVAAATGACVAATARSVARKRLPFRAR